MSDWIQNAGFSVNTSIIKPKPFIRLQAPRARLIVEQPSGSWFEEVGTRLNDLCALERGWDGYTGEPVNFETANFAVSILNSVMIDDFPTPQIIPGTGGDLQIEWHLDDVDIELHVKKPNDVEAWREDATQCPDGEEVELTSDFIVVAQWIEQVAERTRGEHQAVA